MYQPTLEEFLKLAAQGNLIPVTRRILADFETPLSAYRKIRGPDESFLFESVEGGEHLGRYSFVGCNPRAIIKQTANRIEVCCCVCCRVFSAALLRRGRCGGACRVDRKSVV